MVCATVGGGFHEYLAHLKGKGSVNSKFLQNYNFERKVSKDTKSKKVEMLTKPNET